MFSNLLYNLFIFLVFKFYQFLISALRYYFAFIPQWCDLSDELFHPFNHPVSHTFTLSPILCLTQVLYKHSLIYNILCNCCVN